MKKIFILILLLLCFIATNANATEVNDNILNFRKSEIEHKTLSSVVCISVNSLENIAIGFDDKNINVYDKNGKFKYSYTFDFNGSYVFKLDNLNNIIIFPARGENYYTFNSDAKLLQTRQFTDSTESDKYYRKLSSNRNININGNSYLLKEGFIYSKLLKIDTNGNETVIYDIGFNSVTKIIIGLFLFAFVLIVSWVIAKVFQTIKVK